MLSLLISIQLACSIGGLLASEDSPRDVVNQLPIPRMNGALLFSDDCSGNGGAQAMFGDEYMAFSYVDGLCQITANANSSVLPVMYAAPIPTNFIVEYELGIISANSGSKYGIIFRSDDVSGGLAHYYYITVKPADKSVDFDVWNNQWLREESANISSDFLGTDKTTLLRLEVLDNEFRVFLDGVFVIEFMDDQIVTPGILGISINSTGAPETFYYDNLKIYEIIP
ncbi:MAG: hypothetical protein HN922_11895 [Anaerolineae bacterium]|nr:hypothetical protein [Anaerolineae bacterium]MBT7782403.1 hypothetical protein [Anaerolineae bacterium]